MIVGSGIFRTKLPLGFQAGGINCGVRLYRPDLGAIISDIPAVTAGVFTQNKYKGAPVIYCEKLLPADNIKAIVTNSGEANAATGQEGIIHNLAMAKALADTLQCDASQVLTASTGVIGKPLSIDKITQALPQLVKKMTNIAENFATAILTTDLVPKTVYKELQLSTGKICITGICKGSGMIHPNMATLLGYLLSDVQLTTKQAQYFLKKVTDKSFNMISVDGETSTNDSVFLMANGKSGVKLETSEDEAVFYHALLEIAVTLAKSIARDGEGASKLIEVLVSGMESESQAQLLAKSIITSPLIKTAIYGLSPNWGRIICRIGSVCTEENVAYFSHIAINGIKLFSQEKGIEAINNADLKTQLAKDTVTVSIVFSQGTHSATVWGCDLTEGYVNINTGYIS